MAGEMAGQMIVHVVTTIHHGGAERVVLELARAQRALGADARVVCLQEVGGLLPIFESAGIPVILLEGADRPGAIRTAWRLGGWLRKHRPDVVHTHNSAPQVAAGLGEKLRRWRQPGTALIHTEHGRIGDLRPRLLAMRRWAATEFDAVVAVSADAQANLMEHGIRTARGVIVVLNGVAVDRFTAKADEYGAVAVHVGRLNRIKGQDILVQAMVTVKQAMANARVVIVGDGPTRAELEAEVASLGLTDVIRFAGAIDDVRSQLVASSLFVLPSRSEGISIALLEAMATALPIVATDVGGNREVVDEASGILVPAEDPSALAAAMISILSSPSRARAMGAAARAQVSHRFSSDATVRAYAQEYDRARSARPGERVGRAA